MRKRLLIALAAIVVVAIPAVAFAEKFNTRITIHADNEQNRIFGVVRSPEIACEKRREVRLYGPEGARKRGQEFRRYAVTLTNRFGEYHFDGGLTQSKGGNGGFIFLPPGDYYTRALRKDFPGDVCRRDDSRVVTLEGNPLPP
jgi:hypothetical protein